MEFIKKYTPSLLLNILRPVYIKITNRPIINYFKTNHNRNTLISYITSPFRRGVNLKHTNQVESLEIAEIFNQLGYNVDIVDYNYRKNINYSKYNIIFGFGEPLINSYYYRKHDILTIYYGTGMHVCHQNHATLKRIEEVYKKKGVWLLESGRIVEKTWAAQTTLVDYIITLGNTIAAESYQKYFPRKIYNIPASYYKIFDYEQILNNKNFFKARNHFLWFGGSGLIHKGLDLLLDIFKEMPELHLHICGPIDNEPKFKECYLNELYNTKNIHTYGFINLKSETFRTILSQCAFVIFPSCSEGGSPSVINVMANGGLIPIVTKEASIDIRDFGIEIEELTCRSIINSIIQATCLSIDEIKKMSLKCAKYTTANHSIEKYSFELKKALIDILKQIR